MRAGCWMALLTLFLGGCAMTRYTDTSRTAMEQLLISNAVDQALDRVDFQQLSGQSVFIDDKYVECVDKAYIVGCVHHRVLAAGAKLADKADSAEIVLEVRSGGVGTDKVESFFGIPKIALPGPMPLSLPEVKFVGRETQTGMAKLGIVAYHAKDRRAVGEGGMALAKSHDHGWTVLGMGPWFSGEVREEVTAATTSSSVSSETARTAAKRGYRTPQGSLASVPVADGRAAAVVAAAKQPAAAPGVSAPAIADIRGQSRPVAVRPASTPLPSGPAAGPPGAYPTVPPGGYPLGPPSGTFPVMPSPGTLGGF